MAALEAVRARAGSGPVAIVVKGYPRLSETFIAQEIAELESRGLDIRIVSLRRPTDPASHPLHRRIRAPVAYLPEYLWREPARVARAFAAVRQWPAWPEVRALWWRDFMRDPTPNRVRRLGQAAVLAAELDPAVTHLYAHFLHTPASVARYAAKLSGRTWSVSAHARDVWTIPDWEKREKLACCQWAVTCNGASFAALAPLAPEGRLELAYHGLDFRRFPTPAGPPSRRDGSDPNDPVVILSVGRAVAKKGYDVLLAALAQLPPGLHWRFEHVGGGAKASALRAEAGRFGIAGRVRWHGPLAEGEVLRHYRAADVFVLASRVDRDGDRDGLPNVLMEAQSQRLACVATRLAAIPELIHDGATGLLVPPDDAVALSAALAALIRDPDRRRVLGDAGFSRVRAHFAMSQCFERLGRHFALSATGARAAGAT
jgi:glycosyltransferase involved in cell wall biosynthesis